MGSGSNLLVADAGVRGLVVKLDSELTTIELDGIAGDRLVCGGGARLPAVSAVAARAGLSGIEFGVSIPGTVGGAVRMNANAYGGALADVLEWVDVVSADGTTRRTPDQLGFSYRRSNLARARSSRAPGSSSNRPRRRRSRRRSPTCASDARRRSPPGSRPSARLSRTPMIRAPQGRTAGQLLDAAGCRGLRVGGAGFSAKHANFVENFGERDHGGRRRADGRRTGARQAGVRARARARGPGARSGRVSGD